MEQRGTAYTGRPRRADKSVYSDRQTGKVAYAVGTHLVRKWYARQHGHVVDVTVAGGGSVALPWHINSDSDEALVVAGGVRIDGDSVMNGSVLLTSGIRIQGDVHMDKPVQMQGQLSLTQGLYVDGGSEVHGLSTFDEVQVVSDVNIDLCLSQLS